MESSLVIELKVACVDTGYFVGLTPARNFQFNLGSHEMNSNKRWSKAHDEL
jgi:hypothetical protein